MLSNDPAMVRIFKMIDRVSAVDYPVVIQGESGTGKELVARAIHRRSARANLPFVPVNVGAMAETLLESELFGHERGAFTDAVAAKRGVFEETDGGTLFLDEIAETAPALQVKLLRVLEDGEVRRIGATGTITVDVRVISATNADLEQAVERGEFRTDLYYRLSVLSIQLPPLRDRIGDIPVLANSFLRLEAGKQRTPIGRFSEEVMAELVKYSWPGNVRELRNMVETALCAFGSASDIEASTPPYEIRLKHMPTLSEKASLSARKSRLTALPFYKARQKFEQEYIESLLSRHDFNISAASRAGEISRKSLTTKAKRYSLL